MKILVTGSAGFIGQNMVKSLCEDHQITTYDIATHDEHPQIEGHDWIIHLGAITSTTETDVDRVFAHNVDYSVWLLDQAIKHGVNFQWASSASVYGPKCRHFHEQAPPDPRTPYAWSKYVLERHCKQHWDSKIRIQGFRYFNVHGAHEDHKGSQASPQHRFALQAKTEGKIKVFEGSEQFFRDFVPVEQVIDTHRQFFSVPVSGLWNVGTGIASSFMQVALKHGVPVVTIPMPDNLLNHYQSCTCADMTHTRETLRRFTPASHTTK